MPRRVDRERAEVVRAVVRGAVDVRTIVDRVRRVGRVVCDRRAQRLRVARQSLARRRVHGRLEEDARRRVEVRGDPRVSDLVEDRSRGVAAARRGVVVRGVERFEGGFETAALRAVAEEPRGEARDARACDSFACLPRRRRTEGGAREADGARISPTGLSRDKPTLARISPTGLAETSIR